MTEDDRMERAKRIRRMREGKRVGDEADEETGDEETPDETNEERADEAQAGEGTAEREGTGESTPESAAEQVSSETAQASEPEKATTDGGTGQVAEEVDEDAAGGDEEATEVDDEAAETVENVSGTRATVPSAEEMAAALEGEPAPAGEQDDSEAAQAVAEASAARADEAAAGAADEKPAALQQAAAQADAEDDAPVGAGRAGAATTTTEEQTRVLEFTLDDEQYCLDIQYIEEIVKQEHITRVPNTPEFVEGVVDLRGQITTILNPKVTIGKENTEAGDLIVVFDGDSFEDQGYVGWIVDDVKQVSPVTEDQVNDPPMDDDHIQGVIDREEDDEFVVWTSPELAFEEDI